MKRWNCAAALAALFMLLAPLSGFAQSVELSGKADGFVLSGELLGFNGGQYRLGTKYGPMTVDADRVICVGERCPDLSRHVPRLRFGVEDDLAEVVLPALIRAFALREGLVVEQKEQRYSLLNRQSGQEIGTVEIKRIADTATLKPLVQGEIDSIILRRAITSDERTAGLEAGLGDLTDWRRSHVFALDSFVPAVSVPNPLNELALSTLTLDETSTPEVLIPTASKSLRLALEATFQKTLPDTPLSVNEINEQTQQSDTALGITLYSNRARLRQVALTGECGFSIRATRRTIKSKDYPMVAPIYIYTPRHRLPEFSRQFLSFTKSSAAQVVIRRSGLIDQAPEEIAIQSQGQRFLNAIKSLEPDDRLVDTRRLVSALDGMARLTTTFRFEEGSSKLDAPSVSNIRRLAAMMQQRMFDGRKLVFAGFTDGVGSASGNREISLRRAEAVRDRVVFAANLPRRNRVEIQVEGFGEALPMLCDDTALGRHTNRRVEVWVR